MRTKHGGRPPIRIDREILLEVYKKTGSVRAAGEFFGVSKDTVQRKMVEYGIQRKKLKWVMPD